MAGRSGQGGESVTFVISVAAELAGMHPQTLRQYDRLGLVTPARTKGRGRRYTKQDIQRLRDVQRMSQDEGINLEGIRRILELERRVEALEAERARMRTQLAEAEMRRNRVFVASPT
ncbi:heat shock protein transcriptional repressor HspR, partial [Pauljensenia hongkongensis]|uniref:heat shock protein transcriptional repressor HspR n=1 Tax=Pauljensenia hongkongensis TaxID=178339 RepID=UPI0001F662A8